MTRTHSRTLPLLVWIVTGLAFLILLVHLFAGAVLRYQLEVLLHPQEGRGTYLGDVHLNLFTGLLSVEGVEVTDGDTECPQRCWKKGSLSRTFS